MISLESNFINQNAKLLLRHITSSSISIYHVDDINHLRIVNIHTFPRWILGLFYSKWLERRIGRKFSICVDISTPINFLTITNNDDAVKAVEYFICHLKKSYSNYAPTEDINCSSSSSLNKTTCKFSFIFISCFYETFPSHSLGARNLSLAVKRKNLSSSHCMSLHCFQLESERRRQRRKSLS